MVDITSYKEKVRQTRTHAPTLWAVVLQEKDNLSTEEFLAKVATWLAILDTDLKENEAGMSFQARPAASETNFRQHQGGR